MILIMLISKDFAYHWLFVFLIKKIASILHRITKTCTGFEHKRYQSLIYLGQTYMRS